MEQEVTDSEWSEFKSIVYDISKRQSDPKDFVKQLGRSLGYVRKIILDIV